MEIHNELILIKNIIQGMQKAKKIVQIYPKNNPVYIKTLKDLSDQFNEFFQHSNLLQLHIAKNDILYDSESVYHDPEKHDNLALLFFKDGLRELTFKKGLTCKETEDFIKIIALDFERDIVEEDIVILFWEKDFDNIQYVVENSFLSEADDFEKEALNELQQEASGPDTLKEVYDEIFSEEDDDEKQEVILDITDKDLRLLLEELNNYALDKTEKYFNMLFELLSEAGKDHDYQDIINYFMAAISFSVKNGNLGAVTDVQEKLKQMIDDERTDEEIRKCAAKLLSFTGGYSIIELIGNMLNSGQEIEEKAFKRFFSLLEKDAILPFIKILGELKAMQARRLVIEALVYLGQKDISSIYSKLNDSKWYVVRNIVYILRKIGDIKTVPYLLKPLGHEDIRVRKEVIGTLGKLGGDKAVAALLECLKDPDMQVRKAALSALGNTGSAAAKKIIMEQISGRPFKEKSFDEKKLYFEALSRWKDEDVYAFLVKILAKKSFFITSKDYDNKACAAYGLGLIGRKEAVPLLNEYREISNKLLRNLHMLRFRG